MREFNLVLALGVRFVFIAVFVWLCGLVGFIPTLTATLCLYGLYLLVTRILLPVVIVISVSGLLLAAFMLVAASL